MCRRHIQEGGAHVRVRAVHGLGGEGRDGGWREVGAAFALKVSQGRFDLLLVPKTRREHSLCSRTMHLHEVRFQLQHAHRPTHTHARARAGKLQTH